MNVLAGRRLIFAAGDAALCLIHYERGGIAHFYDGISAPPGVGPPLERSLGERRLLGYASPSK